MECDGDKAKLMECGKQATSECSSEMTAVITCEGQSGDTTGSSQQEQEPAYPKRPLLGQLPLANPYLIDCSTKLDDYMFQGDPGSIYVVYCPSGCVADVSVIHGAGIYDLESPLCKAAIHAGTINDQGGFVTVRISWPLKSFKSVQNGRLISL